MAVATRQTVVEAFDEALKAYSDLTDLDAKFELVAGELMKIGNRGYQLARKERIEGTAPEPVTTTDVDEPTIALDALNLKDLRARARDLDIAGASKMRKAELVSAITDAPH